MDIQAGAQYSAFHSLDTALESVSHDLVYDPSTKQLCIRSHASNKNVPPCECPLGESQLESDQAPLTLPSSKLSYACELRKQSDSDSGCSGLSSTDSITENGTQRCISDGPQSYGFYPEINENVDDLNLSLSSLHNDPNNRLSKSKLFIQNMLTRLTSSVSNYEPNDLYASAKQLERCSFSSAASSNADSECTSESIDDSAFTLAKRPANLPPKNEEEERRHQAEFNEIKKQVKKRELKVLKLKKRFLLKQNRQEDQICEAIRCWTSDILPTWPSSNKAKRTRELWWSGIPSPIRPKVWSLSIGNDLRITDELFRICVERSKERIWTKQFLCRRSSNPYPSTSTTNATKQHRRVCSQPIEHNEGLSMRELTKKLSDTCIRESNVESAKCVSDSEEDEEDKNESTADLIKLDVSRTFAQLGLFQEGGPYHQSLSDVLAAYAVYRPDLGYCQGMSFLAAMLLLNLDSAASAFTALANLLNNELLLSFYRLNEAKMQVVYAYYDRQLQALLPRLANHFVAIGLSTDLFLVDQVYTLFSRSLPLDCVCRVWDVFLRDGHEFLVRASLGILVLYEDTLLASEFVDVAQFLSRLPEQMHIDKYFEAIASVKLVPPQLFQSESHNELAKGPEPSLLTRKLRQLR